MAKMSHTPSPLYSKIYALVRRIPAGHVNSYGQIAAQVGTSARVVGFAMAALPHGSDVPWHRVVNSKGQISHRNNSEGAMLQQRLLEAEGVIVSGNQFNLNQYLWLPYSHSDK
jgi:methylated-DNA-protein-cysteine methyltransferase-like protein